MAPNAPKKPKKPKKGLRRVHLSPEISDASPWIAPSKTHKHFAMIEVVKCAECEGGFWDQISV